MTSKVHIQMWKFDVFNHRKSEPMSSFSLIQNKSDCILFFTVFQMTYKIFSTCFDKVMGTVKNESVPRNESIFGQIIINERMRTKMSNSRDSIE